jgi:twitching motility protein PilT
LDQQRLEDLLSSLHRVGASALHLVPGRPPSLRVQRRLVAGDEAALAAADIDELIRDLLFTDHRQRLSRSGQVEVLYVARGGRRYRATVAELDGEHSLVLRPVPEAPPNLDSLELPEQIAAFAQARNGLVLVAGCFGSGRSSTIAALVDALNQDSGRHIVTIESSIEFLQPPGAALLHQREVAVHVASAPTGIREAVAIGADTIVVAEVGDAETLDAALTAVESGCCVIAGVEAGSVQSALSQLVLMAPIEVRARLRTRLSRALRGLAAQSLLQRSHRPGCVAVVEILVGNGPVRQAIRLGNFHELPGIMRRCRGLGMQTTDLALRGLLARHQISQEEALLHASDRDQVLTNGLLPAGAR